MKLKHLFLILTFLVIGINTVEAKSIEYNLTIDKDLTFHENNIYIVKESELDKSGNYDFMTSVVNDKIYFDNDSSVPYTKTKKKVNGEYMVTLKNNYSSIFLTGSRILNECFSKFDFRDNESSLSIKTTSPFYCSSRADSIVINIKTDLEVTSTNSNNKNGNTYTWNNIDDNFTLNFSARIPEIETTPMEEGFENPETTTENNDNITDDETNKEEQTSEEETQKKETNYMTVGIISAVVVLSIIIVILILKRKNSNLNKI